MVKKRKKKRTPRKRSETTIPIGGESHNIPSYHTEVKRVAALGVTSNPKRAKQLKSFLRAQRDKYRK